MIYDHLKAATLVVAAGISMTVGKIAGILGQTSTGDIGLIEKYIDKGGTTLGLILAIVAVIYFVRENKSLSNFIAKLHEKQLEETAKSTEARLAQTEAVENTNRVVGDLSRAVDKLADKVK